MANHISALSTTAADNVQANIGVEFDEGVLASALNNQLRAFATIFASFYGDLSGTKTSAGSANAYTLTTGDSLSALPSGCIFAFKANHDSTGAATLNVDGIGATALKKNLSQDIAAGDILNGMIVVAIYDGTNFQVVSQLAGPLSADLDLNGNALVLDPDGDTVIRSSADDAITFEPGGSVVATMNAAGFLAGADIDLDGNALTLDADGDTYMQASTDDQIDLYIGGSHEVAFLTSGMVPAFDFGYNIGSTTGRIGTINVGSLNVFSGSVFSGNITLSGSLTFQNGTYSLDLSGSDLIFDADGDTYAHEVADDTVTFVVGGVDEFRFDTAALFPTTNDGYDLGKTTHRWANIYARDGNFDQTLTLDGNDVVDDRGVTDFDPECEFATNGDFSPTYTLQEGSLYRVGDLCICTLWLGFTTNAYTTASGDFRVTNIPVGVAGDAGAYSFPLARWVGIDTPASQTMLGAQFNGGTGKFRLLSSGDNTSVTVMNTGHVKPSTAVQIAATFVFRAIS